tara:strand:+ start:4955 stop:5815 length:861 start_codon:yes stop_codon:yes gene_type:complete
MDSTKINDKFLKLFQSFIKDIITTLPEYSQILSDNYSDILDLETIEDIFENEQLKLFSECIYDNNTYITKRNRKFFDNNSNLLEGISIKSLWNQDIIPKNRNTIWKYLQAFCIIIMNIKSSGDLKKLISGEDQDIEIKDKKDLKELKKMNLMTQDIQHKNMGSGSGSEDFEGGFEGGIGEGLEKMLDGSSIGKIAKDIATGLNLEELNINPEDEKGMDISNIMNSSNFMGIFNQINEQVKKKFESGEINDELISSEAESLMPNMLNNPIFKNMLGSDIFNNINKNN